MLNPNSQKRELAYIVTIDEIQSIPNYDRVEHARVNGWWVVVRKGQFKVGDYAIYIEVDAQVPEKEPFMFLEKKHFKVKTQKMCKVLSQGLLMSLRDFTSLENPPSWALSLEARARENKDIKGEFLTEVMDITYATADDRKRKAASADKYKLMAQRNGKLFAKQPFHWLMQRKWGKKLLFIFFGKKKDKKKGFPKHFPYIKVTDEERVENIPWILQDKTPWVQTTKIDGTSATYILERKPFHRFEYYVCSRNVRQLTSDQGCYHDDNVYWRMEFKFHIKDFLLKQLKQHPEWKYVGLQGEIAGPGVQSNPHKLKELNFYGFNFIDSEKGRWNSIIARELAKNYGILWVPIISNNWINPDTMEEMKAAATGPCELEGASGLREGYVYRSQDGSRSFKNVSREYLLKVHQ